MNMNLLFKGLCKVFLEIPRISIYETNTTRDNYHGFNSRSHHQFCDKA
jgi:hypothetical protein